MSPAIESAAIPLAVVGCDFRVASSSWRSRLVLADDEAVEIAAGLARNAASDGFVELATCNRNEWIVSTVDPRWSVALLSSLMSDRLGPAAREWFSAYTYVGEDAARHVFRVALGQESLVVGERQIAGQLQDALGRARARNTSSRVLNGLGTVVGRLVRNGARRGCVGSASVGVHSLAVSFLEAQLANAPSPEGRGRVVVVGLGQIGRRVLGLLEQSRLEPIRVNRTVEAGSDRVRSLDALPGLLEEARAVVVCTGAPRSILRVTDLPERDPARPLLVIDIGIPSQVERGAPRPGVTVVGLDELTAFHRQSPASVVSAPPTDDIDDLVRRALVELRIFCNEPAFTEILDAVQRSHGRAVAEEIPRLISERLGYLPEALRARLGQDLHSIITGYTGDVLRTIREVTEHMGESACPDER